MVLVRSSRNLVVWMVALLLVVGSVWVSGVGRAAAGSATPVVYIATGENFPDALGAGPVAAMVKGPVLLVRRDSIPGETAAELVRMSPDKIVIVGGTAAVSQAVENGLAPYAATVQRIAGANRYDTAAKLSAATYPVSLDADTLDGQDSSVFARASDVYTKAEIDASPAGALFASGAVLSDGATATGSTSFGNFTTARQGTGRYGIVFSALDPGCTRPAPLPLVTITTGSGSAFIASVSRNCGTGDTSVNVWTTNISGTVADRGFNFVVYYTG
jgi:hypothetical protein